MLQNLKFRNLEVLITQVKKGSFFDIVDDCFDRFPALLAETALLKYQICLARDGGSLGLKEERSLFYVLADFGPVEIKLGGHQFDLQLQCLLVVVKGQTG